MDWNLNLKRLMGEATQLVRSGQLADATRAIQQLADGRFLVLEDERQRPFSLVSIASDGGVDSAPLRPGWLEAWLDSSDDFWKLDDLEGIALDNAGNIHAVTSHSRDGDGDERKSRDKLVRFRIEAGRVVAPKVVNGLKPALLAAHPVLEAAAAKREVKREGGLNIEALEFGPDGQTLLIGFRSPLLDGRALIASLENTAEMFDAGAPPRIAASLITLDLDGDGLPLIPPTEGRVRAFLAANDRYPDEVIAQLPPARAECTVEKIAINAVMAGCKPEYLPVVIAAGAMVVLTTSVSGIDYVLIYIRRAVAVSRARAAAAR